MTLSTRCLPGAWPLCWRAGCSPSEKELTAFQDITAQSGLSAYEGMTHGAAWGDYDGDGQPLSNGMRTLYKWAGTCAGARQDVA